LPNLSHHRNTALAKIVGHKHQRFRLGYAASQAEVGLQHFALEVIGCGSTSKVG